MWWICLGYFRLSLCPLYWWNWDFSAYLWSFRWWYYKFTPRFCWANVGPWPRVWIHRLCTRAGGKRRILNLHWNYNLKISFHHLSTFTDIPMLPLRIWPTVVIVVSSLPFSWMWASLLPVFPILLWLPRILNWWEIALPMGNFISHFVTGPLLWGYS